MPLAALGPPWQRPRCFAALILIAPLNYVRCVGPRYGSIGTSFAYFLERYPLLNWPALIRSYYENMLRIS